MTKRTRNQSSTAIAEPEVHAEAADSQRVHVGEVGRPVSAEQIAQRAYELYLDRGCQDGADLDDWLQAERELGRSTSAIGRTPE